LRRKKRKKSRMRTWVLVYLIEGGRKEFHGRYLFACAFYDGHFYLLINGIDPYTLKQGGKTRIPKGVGWEWEWV
jgi:hypothetical protein